MKSSEVKYFKELKDKDYKVEQLSKQIRENEEEWVIFRSPLKIHNYKRSETLKKLSETTKMPLSNIIKTTKLP